MGNKVIQKTSFNIIDSSELKEFLSSVNILDGFFVDTNLSISTKCLVIINYLINHLSISSNIGDDLYHYKSCDIFPGVSIPFDEESLKKIEKFKLNCQLIRHLSITNANINYVEEFIELNNFHHLVTLQLENVPIKLVQHLKLHRATLMKLCVHNCISDMESLVELCGGDQSFSGYWTNLMHLDVRYNNLRFIDKSVILLSNLTVLDVSRNNLESIAFVEKIPTLACLNASYNCIDILPHIPNHCLRVLIIGYNYLHGLQEIRNFKLLSTLNASYNMISTVNYLQQLNELDYLKDLILNGNPICNGDDYRISVLSVVSTRVIVNFALDGRIFSKRERVYLRKTPVIVIAPATSSNSHFNSQVPIIKPKPRELDIGNYNASSPDIMPGSYTRNLGRIAKINDQDFLDEQETLYSHETAACTIIEKDPIQFNKRDTFERREFTIDTPEDTDYDKTMTTVEDLSSNAIAASKLKPFYIGEKTSNLICVSNKHRTSFANVSFQIIEHRFMAVENLSTAVDNLNLWTLLVAYQDSESSQILRLSFCDEISCQENKQISLLNRSLEFAKSDDLITFVEHLFVYLNEFTISLENVSNIMNTFVLMVCSQCHSNYRFNYENPRPIICIDCLGVQFRFENPSHLPKPVVKNEVTVLQTGFSPSKAKTYLKPPTSTLVIKAISFDNILQGAHSESGLSNSTSYCTANEERNDIESTKSEVESLYESNDYYLHDSHSDTMNLEMPIDYHNNSHLFGNPENIIPNLPDQDASVLYLNTLYKSNWVALEPLSNVSIYMDNVTKIDDRIKVYFLTKVMHDHEDIHAAFKSNLLYKTTSSLTTEAFVVISNFRILFYSWVDKDSQSLEECLKLIVEFQLKQLLQIDNCLNHQWIDIKFKKNCRALLFIGDSRATKNIMQILIEIGSSCVLKLGIRTLKDIDKLKSQQVKEDMTKAMNDDDSNIRALDNCEYYLVKSFNGHVEHDISLSDNAPKVIGIHSEYLFFIGIKFQNKPFEINFELLFTLSMYDLKNTIIVDSVNNRRCLLEMSNNNESKSINIEFFSPTTRSQVLFYIEKLWKTIFQANLTFELIDSS